MFEGIKFDCLLLFLSQIQKLLGVNYQNFHK